MPLQVPFVVVSVEPTVVVPEITGGAELVGASSAGGGVVVITSWGGLAPVRLDSATAVALVVASWKEAVPEATALVTSIVSHAPATIGPLEPRTAPAAGAFDAVIPVSVQVESATLRTVNPVDCALVAKIRSWALDTGPTSPDRLKRR